jgi:predicted DNA-binding transcriptional regulator YafY
LSTFGGTIELMRADRLVATLLLMQARGRVTAAEVAEELEVSVATARRDLEALSAAGIPVYPQPGRGGGWSLVGGARTDLSGLSAAEAQALFLLVGPAAAVAPEAKAALRKLVRALPQTFRADAEAAATAVVIDPARWGERVPERSDLVELLQQAVVRRRKVRFSYASRGRERAERTVDPWGLIDKDEIWYLIAGTERGQRTFRVDRIADAVVADETFERPADFDLSSAWGEVVTEVEQRRSGVSATVLVAARFVFVLRHQYGRHCEVLDTLADGRVRVRVSAPTPLMIAQPLAGWGAMLDVEDSPEVRAELARLGAELVECYERAGDSPMS